MLARAHFGLVDRIAAARTDGQLRELRVRVAATHMHPLERRALECQLRSRALAADSEARPVGSAD